MNSLLSKFASGLIIAGLSVANVNLANAQASEYTCHRAAKPAQWVKTRIPKGNWGPQHNTNKWKYDAVPRKDIYRHKRGKRTVGTRCKGLGYNYGTHKVDFEGNQDWCANYVSGVSEAYQNTSCPSGFSISSDKKSCTRAAKPARWVKTRIPKGNWGPQHNTNKWKYDAVPRKDIYRHKRGKRTVGTRCKGLGYNYGTHKVDFEGNQDWCANYVSAVPSKTINASCPAGFSLKPKTSAQSSNRLGNSLVKRRAKALTRK